MNTLNQIDERLISFEEASRLMGGLHPNTIRQRKGGTEDLTHVPGFGRRVPYGRDVPGGLRLYDARHTATTHLLENGASPAAVKEWMGWADSSFLSYYSHSTEKAREKVGRSLARLAGRKIA